MINRAFILAAGVLVIAVSSMPARADADGHVNFFLGQKSLDSDDWDPADKQGEFGAIMSFGEASWPIHIAVDVLGSAAEEDFFDPEFGNTILTAATFEIAAGVRKIWNTGKTCPYVGGGVAVIAASAEFDYGGLASFDADDSGFGPWASAGIFWRLGNRFNIGLDLRWSDAEVDLDFGPGFVLRDVGAGGLHGGLTLGFGW